MVRVERSQTRQNGLLVRFAGVTDRTAAEHLSGSALYIDPDQRRPLEPDEYWPDELVGMRVVSVGGDQLGTVQSVIEGSAQYRLVVHGDRGGFEVPFVSALVPEVDPEAGCIVVADIPGLLPD